MIPTLKLRSPAKTVPASQTPEKGSGIVKEDVNPFHRLPDKLVHQVIRKLDFADAFSFGHVDRRTHRIARETWAPQVQLWLEEARAGTQEMIGRLEGARTGGTAARVAALVAAIDFLSHLHLGFRDLLGPRQALPQRWQLLRLVQGEVEDLAGEDILKPALGENMLTPGMAGAVIAAVQRFLETTPAPLRAWADAELLKGPTMPVSRRLQAACRNMVRNQLKQPGARIAAMVRLREPAGALHVQPTQALAADNLQFIAGLWLYIPSREHLEFLAFLKPLLAPAPMALRELLAQEIMLAGQKKLAMEFEALSAEEQRRSWPVLSQQIEARTFDAIVQVLAGSPAGP